jgi:hypothetical protein
MMLYQLRLVDMQLRERPQSERGLRGRQRRDMAQKGLQALALSERSA